MEEQKFNDLIQAAKNYYAGNPTGMTDEQYDKLFAEAKHDIENFNIFNYINSNSDRSDVKHYYPFTPQEFKIQFSSPEELNSIWKNSNIDLNQYIITPKWDGCSIRAYYKNGHLSDIITRSDESYGKRKFDQLKKKVPNNVNQNVICIDFEALTSNEDYGDDTRSHSNGLINSCYKQDEIDQYLILIPFKVTCNTNMNYLDAMRLVFKDDEICALRCYFKEFNYIDRFIEWHGKHYPIDGYVLYTDTATPHKIYKFYFNQNPTTIVNDIQWTYTNKHCWNPKVIVDPVYIDGRWISAASSNGYARLQSIKAGIGAEVSIILANSTIPQVYEVIKESENYNLPKECPYCGQPLAEVVGKLRCTNKHCTKLEESAKQYIDWYMNKAEVTWNNLDKSKFNINDLMNSLFESLIIERFNKSDLVIYLINELLNQNNGVVNKEQFIKIFYDNMTWNQWYIFQCYQEIYWEYFNKYISIV